MIDEKRIKNLSEHLKKTHSPIFSAMLIVFSLEDEIKELKKENKRLKEDNKLLSWSS